MTQLRLALIAIAAVSIGPTAAVAQTKSEPRIFTVTRALRTSDARDAELRHGFQVTGAVGRHLTRRIVVEAEVGGGNFAPARPASSHNVNLLFVSVNLDYVWERVAGARLSLAAPARTVTAKIPQGFRTDRSSE